MKVITKGSGERISLKAPVAAAKMPPLPAPAAIRTLSLRQLRK